MKIGRNDPCRCGSGKKYKKCCMGKEVVPSQTLGYRRLSEVYLRLEGALMRLAERIYGKQAAAVAMHEFLLWPEPDDEFEEDLLARSEPLFWPWFLFNWIYDPNDVDEVLDGPENRTLAELYAEEHGDRLDSLEKKLIAAINREPYTFWEIVSVEPGAGMVLQDVLRGIRLAVEEHKGSVFVQPGDLVFGRAVSVEGVGMLAGLGTTVIPPDRKTHIIDLRKRMRGRRKAGLDRDSLHDWDSEIRELYLHIEQALHTLPQVANTDGHPMEFHRQVYEIASAAEAFEKLTDLCSTINREELLEQAERDSTGRIIRAEITWDRKGHKGSSGLPSTTLGRIVIDGRRLTAEVNSAERARQLRREIEARLGEDGRFQVDEIQDMDAIMHRARAGAAEVKPSRKHEELMQDPQVQEQLAAMLSKHWEGWVDEKIPALGGKTPRKAVKTADGREAVEALLRQAERDRGQDRFMLAGNRKGIERVREILGLKGR